MHNLSGTKKVPNFDIRVEISIKISMKKGILYKADPDLQKERTIEL